MKKLILCTLIFLSYTLVSCSKQIKGKVLDNFGKPIQDVAITIQNSQYEAKTNSSGEYSIDYAAGEIVLNFYKEGYYASGEILYIAEKQEYPVKDIKLVKIPPRAGIYISTKESPDYTRLIRGTSIERKQVTNNNHTFYLQNKDSINIIKTSSLEDIGIYHFYQKQHQLGIVGEDNRVAEISRGLFTRLVANEYIKGTKSEYSDEMFRHLIAPKYDVDYIYIFESGFKNMKNPNTSYCLFRFEK